MRISAPAASLAALLLAALPIGPPAEARAADDTPAEETEAAFACTEGVDLPLDGLTEENAPAVERALRKMTRPRYQCPACKMKADWQATCEGCGELYEERPTGVPLFSAVRLDPASGRACLEIDRSGVVSMMRLGEVLAPTGVRIRRAELELVAWTRVTVRMDPRDVAKAKRALESPGLFASIGVRTEEDEGTTHFVIQHPPRRPVTLARFAQALGESAPGLVFEDLSWTAACLTCEEKGHRRGWCRACWQAEIRREKNRKRLR